MAVTQSLISFSAMGEKVCSIFAYSDIAPVSHSWNKWFMLGKSTIAYSLLTAF
jgi:hypothetical protein